MAKWRKKPILVTAEIVDTPQYVTTLEGVSEAKPGDYLVTGIDNEQWAIKPKWFKGAYKHISGNTYQRLPQVLDAEEIDESTTVSAPTGPIRGDKGDYMITGTKGEQWFCKPDIFIKTYEKVGKNMEKNGLQKSIDQLGMDTVTRYLPKGMKIHDCAIHGGYLSHYKESNPTCPICCVDSGTGNGTTASDVELFIDMKDAAQAIQGIVQPFIHP